MEDAEGGACQVAPMELMAVGIPMVILNLRCCDDYAKGGEKAIKFDNGNSQTLCEKMIALLSSKNLAEKISNAGAESMKLFLARAVAEKYSGMFQDGSRRI